MFLFLPVPWWRRGEEKSTEGIINNTIYPGVPSLMLPPPLGIPLHPILPVLLWPQEHWAVPVAVEAAVSKCQVHRLIAHLILIANGDPWSSSSPCWNYLRLVFKFIENNCPRKRKMMVVTTSSGDSGVVVYHIWPETPSPSPSTPKGRGVS